MNDTKNYDEALKRVGEKDLMEEFDKAGEDHTFSNKYKKQKEAMLIKMRMESTRPQKQKWSKAMKALVASVAAIILVPATVFAAYKLYTINVTDKNYAKEVDIEEVSQEAKPVEMKIAYLPDGMSEFEPFKYKDANGKSGVTLYLIKVDTNAKFTIDDIEDKQEINLSDGTDVLLGKRAGQETENYHGAIFYDQQGYIVEFWTDGIAEVELTKMLEGISLEETIGTGTTAGSLAALVEPGEGLQAKGESIVEDYPAIEQVYKVNENFICEAIYNVYTKDWKTGQLEMSVEKVEVLDNIAGISEGSKAFGKDDETLADESGEFLPHEREIGEAGDGIDTPAWQTNETQMVNRKLLSVTVKMKNQTGTAVEDISIFPRLSLLAEENGTYQWREEPYRDFSNSKEAYSMDTYGDGNDGKGFYFIDFDKDEEKLITVTFLVDEDELDNAFLTYQSENIDGAWNNYVDVRQ